MIGMRKACCLILTLLIPLCLIACGSITGIGDPNLGVWNAYSVTALGITADADDAFESGISLELKAFGRCTLTAGGDSADAKWTFRNGELTVSGDGTTYAGSIEDAVMTLYINGMEIYFVQPGRPRPTLAPDPTPQPTPPPPREDFSENSSFPSPEPQEPDEDVQLRELRDFWEGDWYGYWKVPLANEYYDFLEDGIWDCYAVIEVDNDLTGTVYFWDDDMELATLNIIIMPEPGFGVKSMAAAESGDFFGYEIGGDSGCVFYDGFGYYPMLTAYGELVDYDYDWFSYEIYLRPWGILWDDIPGYEERPPWHDDWYKNSGLYRNTMREAIDDFDGLIHSAIKSWWR